MIEADVSVIQLTRKDVNKGLGLLNEANYRVW